MLPKEDTQTADKYRTNSSASAVIGNCIGKPCEMFLPTNMAKIKKTESTKFWRRCEATILC